MPAAKSRAEAVRAFLKPLQLALGCVDDAVLNVSPGGYKDVGRTHGATPNRGGEPRWLRIDDHDFVEKVGLLLNVWYAIEEIEGSSRSNRWRARTVGYEFALLDATYSEIAAYHWHPTRSSSVDWPHFHLGPALSYASMVTESHFPTGRVGFEQVVRMAIEDLGVRARRRDWDRVLAGVHALFVRDRSWA